LSESEQQERLGQAQRSYAATLQGRPDIAAKILNEAAVAYENAGRANDAKAMRDQAALVEADPNFSKTVSGLFLASAMGPEKFAQTFKDLNIGGTEEGYRVLTAEEVAAKGLPPGNYQVALGGASKGKVSQIGGGGDKIIVGGERETAFDKETGKALAQQFTQLSKLGLQASRSSVQINQLEQAFRSADVKTGAEGVISTALSRFGIDIPGATQYQQIDALVARLIPLQRPEGSGTTSDKDMENFKRALPSLMGTKEGQLQIIQDMKALADHDMKVGEIANQARSGQISPFEAQRLISELSNPLEKYSVQQNAPPTVSGVVGMPAGPQGAGSKDVDPNNPLLQTPLGQ
jgi:hypothetical protein